MKLDAHCAVDKDFDLKLIECCEPDWTVVPTMYNLLAYEWKCYGCGKKQQQGRSFTCCGPVKKKIVWKPKRVYSDWMKFDSNLTFGYWGSYKKRPEAQHDIAEQMTAIGACWFMERARYLELEGLNEESGSWGSVGVEIACKSWLSGGKQMVNKKTWFSHLFRTGNFKGTGHNGTTFPYPLSGKDVERTKSHQRDIWLNNKWHKQKHKLEWLVDKFSPVPGWE